MSFLHYHQATITPSKLDQRLLVSENIPNSDLASLSISKSVFCLDLLTSHVVFLSLDQGGFTLLQPFVL